MLVRGLQSQHWSSHLSLWWFGILFFIFFSTFLLSSFFQFCVFCLKISVNIFCSCALQRFVSFTISMFIVKIIFFPADWLSWHCSMIFSLQKGFHVSISIHTHTQTHTWRCFFAKNSFVLKYTIKEPCNETIVMQERKKLSSHSIRFIRDSIILLLLSLI